MGLQEQWALGIHAQKAAQAGVAVPPIDQLDDRPVVARIHRGMWIADCECGGAELIWLDEPVFRCSDCHGPWRRVILPDVDERVKITACLLVRPRLNRNWEPGETVSHLVLENLAHDLPEGLL